MEALDIITIIADNFLCVRRLPFQIITYHTYKDGDENKKYIDDNGNPIEVTKEVIVQDFDLEYFKNTKPDELSERTPEQRFAGWKLRFPNGRKLLKETRNIEIGGWWYVKEVRNIDSIVRFNRERDTYCAPTLEEAIQLYLNSKK